MDAAYRKHYGWDAVARSLTHFLLGKSFRMISALTMLLVLVRVLPVDQYAVYVSFQALIAIVDVLTSIGVKKVLFRFLPELRATGNNRAAYRLLLYGMLFRLFVVSMLFLAMLPFLPFIADVFNIGHWAWLLPWYLLLGFVRLTAHWLSECLESFLWQRESQYSMALGSAIAAGGVLVLALGGNLSLDQVVMVAFLGDTAALVMLLSSWLRKWKTDPQRNLGDSNWWGNNRGRAIRYGAWSYALSQSSLLYGSAPNRLVAASALPAAELALLGVADSMMAMARKWVPIRLLMSMVRPLIMARFATTGDFGTATRTADFVFRFNLMLLTLPVVILAVVGTPLLDWITAGKYPAAGYLLMGFLIVLVTQGVRDLLELMVQAIEKPSILFWTNLIQSASLFVALPLLPLIGVWGLVVANLTGMVVANAIVIFRLARQGYRLAVRLDLAIRILLYGVTAGAVGWVCWDATGSLVVTISCIGLAYFALLLAKPPMNGQEKEALATLVRKQFGKLRKRSARDIAAPATADSTER